jgi:hypothetical protein
VVEDPTDAEETITRLRARLAELEKNLEEKSALLRVLAVELCEADLIAMTRIASGRAPDPGADVSLLGLRPSTVLKPADVETTVQRLWRSLPPISGDGRK